MQPGRRWGRASLSHPQSRSGCESPAEGRFLHHQYLLAQFSFGPNGDYQEIKVIEPIHPVLVDAGAPTRAIRFLPSHPHEGDVSAPRNSEARVIATGTSKVTGRQFNIAVAFEPGAEGGPAVAHSTFHHFADYNWDPRLGCPSFVDEPPGDAIMQNTRALTDVHRYVINIAVWLAGVKSS
jgi:hypothetical protein